MKEPWDSRYDFILAGGGLQAGLLAMALSHHRPQAKVLLVERNDRLCGNHTWSFHESDLSEANSKWMASLPLKKWPGYVVKFPGFSRRLGLAYCSLLSCELESALHGIAEQGNLEIRTGSSIVSLTVDSIQTSQGDTYYGDTVIDCRGLQGHPEGLRCGYQKFHGFEIELADEEWPDRLPVLMDATVSQREGFRFLYLLPLSSKRVLIEDTHFSDSRELDRERSFAVLQAYLHDRQIQSWQIVREERGCLPMPYSNHMTPDRTSPLRGGYAAGWFHAATGYSFPLAVRFAEVVATSTPEQIAPRISRLVQQNRFPARCARLLNRMLYRLVAPEKRWTIFRRFYRVLPEETIKRFYGHRFTRFDALRIVFGKPPQGLTPVRFFQSFRAKPCPGSST